MNEEAVPETQETPPAGDESSIPKYRFDQVAAELRSLREAIQIKDQTIEQFRAQMMPSKQESDEDQEILEALDKTQLRAVEKLIGKRINVEKQQLNGMVGALGNKLDEQTFLLNHGKDKEKYLTKIREMRRDYAQRGMFLDYDMAYKFIAFDEIQAKPKAAPKKEESEAPPEKKEAAPPPAQATRAKTGSKSMEEIEAELDEQIRASGKTF